MLDRFTWPRLNETAAESVVVAPAVSPFVHDLPSGARLGLGMPCAPSLPHPSPTGRNARVPRRPSAATAVEKPRSKSPAEKAPVPDASSRCRPARPTRRSNAGPGASPSRTRRGRCSSTNGRRSRPGPAPVRPRRQPAAPIHQARAHPRVAMQRAHGLQVRHGEEALEQDTPERRWQLPRRFENTTLQPLSWHGMGMHQDDAQASASYDRYCGSARARPAEIRQSIRS